MPRMLDLLLGDDFLGGRVLYVGQASSGQCYRTLVAVEGLGLLGLDRASVIAPMAWYEDCLCS